MKEHDDDDYPRRSRTVEKGRKTQKLRNLFKKIDPNSIPQIEEDEEFEELDHFTKIVHARR
jgi:hypothetical protein